ncbi:hypothetical protein F4808DRAFT_449720 [Astrocystis sublimbata]|nr:hypothetical protein F4808DRAFT_449720 [Astrocystis sublimbata]
MTTNALSFILSLEEEWHFDADGKSIRFNEDGTGELECRCNLNYWILAEFEWKDHPSPGSAVTQSDAPTKNAINQPKLLRQDDIEITLTKRIPKSARRWAEANPSGAESMNKNLTDGAYRPKTYTVRLERGNFIQPAYIGSQNKDMPRYELRLLFDKSPYPPRSEWKDPEGASDEGQFWDIVEFVGCPAKDADAAKRSAPMNDPSVSSWNSCVIS